MPSIPTVSTANDADNRYSDREPRFPSSKVKLFATDASVFLSERPRRQSGIAPPPEDPEMGPPTPVPALVAETNYEKVRLW